MGLKTIDGLPIINAKKAIVLEVTSNDITHADPKEPTDCAMARACRRGLGAAEARVHLGRVYLRMRNGKQWVRYIARPKHYAAKSLLLTEAAVLSPANMS